MDFVTAVFRTTARLSETNARGWVTDSALLILFEAARADALRDLGLPYETIQARGINALTVEARFVNYDCAYLEDPLVVHTSMRNGGRLRFSFVYELRRDTDNALIASGETVHVLVESASGQPCRVPEWFCAVLDPLLHNS